LQSPRSFSSPGTTYVGAIGLQLVVVAAVVAIARRLDRPSADPV